MVKQYVFNGIPTHFRPTDQNISACGIVNAQYMAYDARHCDCIRCKKTKAYKQYMDLKTD